MYDCRSQLDLLAASNNVTIYWVPSHIGIDENEKVDKLAKEGAIKSNDNTECTIGMSWTSIRNSIIEMKEKESNAQWRSTRKQRQAKLLIGNRDKKRSNTLISMSRSNLCIITGFLTGHGNTKYHLKNIRRTEDNTCRFCMEEVEDSPHLLECVALDRLRHEILNSYQIDDKNKSRIQVVDLLRFLKKLSLDSID